MLGEHPSTELAVPYKVVATHLDAVLAAEVCDDVGLLKVPYACFRMELARLHAVLSGDAVVLLEDDFRNDRVSYVTLCNGDTNLEIVLVSVLQARVLGAACAHQYDRCDESEKRKSFH